MNQAHNPVNFHPMKNIPYNFDSLLEDVLSSYLKRLVCWYQPLQFQVNFLFQFQLCLSHLRKVDNDLQISVKQSCNDEYLLMQK